MRRLIGVAVLVVVALAFSSRGLAGDKLEPGFSLLFNGKNFDGWKTKKGGESLAGKTEAYNGRFKAVDGMIVIDPKVKGDVIIETVKEFGKDVTIKFDFLPLDKCNNDLFLRGIKFDIILKLKGLKDGWNELEIVIKGDKADYKLNGTSIKTAAAKGTTPFGIRAEFGEIKIKNLRVKE